MSASLDSPIETEKDAVKRRLAHEARFRDEKQRIVESLGGSRAELATPASDARIQRKLKCSKAGKGSSSLLAQSPARGFQATDNRPEQPAPRDALPVALDNIEEPNNHHDMEERHRRPKFRKKACYIVAATIVVVAIGGIVGAVVAFVLSRDSSTSSSSTSDNGVASTSTDEICKLDREALAQCENGVIIALPACAEDAYHGLVDEFSDYLVGTTEGHVCDAAHQGLVALAVSQTNHGKALVDPVMFFAMSTLYFALEGTRWQENKSWLEGSSPCGDLWHGIECSVDESLITVSLENNRLRGFLPTEVGLLSNLKDLRIAANEISGSMPSEIGHLVKLQTLDFQLNPIHAQLPSEIGMLTETTELWVTHTSMTGSIPSEIGNMVKLEYLNLSLNQFTGTLPTELGNLVQLRALILAYLDGVAGTIPSDLVALTRLEYISLVLPKVDASPFPEVVAVASNLREVEISYTHVIGSLPKINHLSHLRQLQLSGLGLTGTIPTEIGLLSNLARLYVGETYHQGTIPSEVGMLTKLTTLGLRDVPKLTGPLPSELGSLTALELVELRKTGISGTIPHQVCELNLPQGVFRYDHCEGDAVSARSCLIDTCSV